MAGCRTLLDHRSVLLRYLVHMVDASINLVQPIRLLFGGIRHFRDSVCDLGNLHYSPSKRLSRLADEFDAVAHLLRRA